MRSPSYPTSTPAQLNKAVIDREGLGKIIKMPHSHHSHSGAFCHHATSTLEEVVQEAIKQGFEVYGLSEHAPRYRFEDLYPEEVELGLRPEDLQAAYQSFLDAAISLRQRYSSQITLLIGIETDYITPIDLSSLKRLVEEDDRIEYLVGSVHHVQGVPIDFSREMWLRAVYQAELGVGSSTMRLGPSGKPELIRGEPSNPRMDPSYIPNSTDLRPYLEQYFDAQYTLIQEHSPEVIGHFDLCLLYIPTINLRDPELENHWEKVERNVRAVIEYGGLFEANSAALRKKWETSYPGKAVLELIIREGGRICLSDDSHGVSQVGLNYVRMRDYLQNAGVESIWHLVPASQRQSGDQAVGRRGRVVARKMDNWLSHLFWKATER